MAGQKRKIGVKALKKVLSDAVENQHITSWYKIVADANMDYMLRRTNEVIHGLLAGDDDTKIDQAITLLALVKAKQNETVQA